MTHNRQMQSPSQYHGHRFQAEIIAYAVGLSHRFSLSFRDVEEVLGERGIIVSYETIRNWCSKFGPAYARRLRQRQGQAGDHWFMDDLFRISSRQNTSLSATAGRGILALPILIALLTLGACTDDAAEMAESEPPANKLSEEEVMSSIAPKCTCRNVMRSKALP